MLAFDGTKAVVLGEIDLKVLIGPYSGYLSCFLTFFRGRLWINTAGVIPLISIKNETYFEEQADLCHGRRRSNCALIYSSTVH